MPAPDEPQVAPPRARRGGRWRARLEMMRPSNCLMAALGTLAGLAVALDGAPTLGTAAAAGAAAFLVAASGNVLNDLRDATLDARAHPGRPLPSGRLRRADAAASAALLAALGAGAAWLAGGLPTLAFALANLLALAAYEAWLKRVGLPGNVLVALLVASTFAFGAVAAGVPPAGWGALWLLMALAFLANVAREVLKDVEDLDADRGERTTLPLQAGPGAARILAFALANAAVLLSIVAFVDRPAGWWPPWLGLLAASDAAFVAAASLSWIDVGRAQRLLKAAMLLALAAFLAGPLVP
jgi:geranylgeranylglycerol-phosphate geranylgeranyltransferase